MIGTEALAMSLQRLLEKITDDERQRARTVVRIGAEVCHFFEGDTDKTMLWMITANPALGEVVPVDLIAMGRADKLLAFVLDARAGEDAAAAMMLPR